MKKLSIRILLQACFLWDSIFWWEVDLIIIVVKLSMANLHFG